MGREVRRVPADWGHPKGSDGQYIPLLGRSYQGDLAEWRLGKKQWERGLWEIWNHEMKGYSWEPHGSSEPWEEAEGEMPDPRRYMPDWPLELRTHWQMYETCSEGTPISPVFDAPEKLARWLAETKASSFGSQTATWEQWLDMIVGPGWAPSAVMVPGKGVISGVVGFRRSETPEGGE